MKKVKDLDGSTLQGAFKTDTGAIVFTDKRAFEGYTIKKDAALRATTEVDELKKQIAELSKIVQMLSKGQ